MHEYEWRLVVPHDRPLRLLEDVRRRLDARHATREYAVIYAQPNFRMKENEMECKRVSFHRAVYHPDGRTWWKWVESEEIPFRLWKRATLQKFTEATGHYQNPFRYEHRTEITFPSDGRLKIYAFRKDSGSCGLTLECEVGLLSKPMPEEARREHMKSIVSTLRPFERLWDLLARERRRPNFPYVLKECVRKPVSSVASERNLEGKNTLWAHKYDGTFGFVYSYADRVVEKWECNARKIRVGTSLGDGLVYGAERMADGTVVLLDVYQVRGSIAFCSEYVLIDFLRSVSLPPRYEIQRYYKCRSVEGATPPRDLPTDGLIFHDTDADRIYKLKSEQTIELVYFDGYLLGSDGRKIKCSSKLENNSVYECSVEGVPIKKRRDRFTGNSRKQIENVLQCA